MPDGLRVWTQACRRECILTDTFHEKQGKLPCAHAGPDITALPHRLTQGRCGSHAQPAPVTGINSTLWL